MEKQDLKKLIDVAAGRVKADLVIRNCKIVNVFSGTIQKGDIAVAGSEIAGIGDYEGETVVDACGRYAAPGFIDSHIHIESSYVSPEEIGRLLVPHGAATIIADPHEIVNVCGIRGLDYMIEAAKGTRLDIKYMLPSCVPATPFDHSGAVVDAEAMKEPITRDEILGLGEFMDYPGVISASEGALDKILLAKKAGKLIDGHCPVLVGKRLNAYAAARICGDHECSSIEEMQERLDRGLYILMRQGSACHDLRALVPGVTEANSRRILLCSDDRQPKTILGEGHIDSHLRICVEEGLDPVTAIRMATLNAAECFRLTDRGAIAPGYRADIVLLDDLKEFHVSKVWIAGELCADGGKYLPKITYTDIAPVAGSVRFVNFSKERLKMHLKTGRVNVIGILPGGVVTEHSVETVRIDEEGDFVYDPEKDLVKVAVVERHHNTGCVGLGILKGYGIKAGAVALSVAHDSHNIVAVGVSNEEIEAAVLALREQQGGIVLVKDGRVIADMPMPIAGLMSDHRGEWVAQKLEDIHRKAFEELGISGGVEPVMTLCFMSLAVIPDIKLTDMGLVDVLNFRFLPLEAE